MARVLAIGLVKLDGQRTADLRRLYGDDVDIADVNATDTAAVRAALADHTWDAIVATLPNPAHRADIDQHPAPKLRAVSARPAHCYRAGQRCFQRYEPAGSAAASAAR